MKKKKNLYNILKNHTLEEYKGKYDISKAIVLSKDAVDKFNKNKKAKSRGNIFNGRNWWLIDNTYYEVGEYLEIKPFVHKSHGAGFKIALASILGGIGIGGALGGGGFAIYKAVKAYNPTPGPEPKVDPIVIGGDGTISVKDKSKIVGTYTIPESIGGVTVKKIADNGFADCTELTELILPSTIESIGQSAFSGCSKLEKVDIPNDSKLTSIARWAFSNCKALKTISIPDSLTSINEGTFNCCSNLENVTISSTSKLSNIAMYAFYECTSLYNFTFPDSLTSISDHAFAESSITSISFGANSKLSTIDNRAFENCTKLESVSFDDEDAAPELSYQIFSGCTALRSCKLPGKITKIPNGTFYKCSSLGSIEIPSTVTEIGSSAFSNCALINGVKLPNNLAKIGSSAFSGCYSLESITIPASVTEIGFYCFDSCYNLATVYVDSDAALKDCNSYGTYITTSLYRYANEVYLGDGLTEEKTNYCQDLKDNFEINGSSGVEGYSNKGTAKTDMFFYPYDDSTIKNTKRYYRCSDKTSTEYTIPSTCTISGTTYDTYKIIAGGFANNDMLQTLTIPSCLGSLGSRSLYNCTSLKTVNFEGTSSLYGIQEECFLNCSNLTNITLPSSLTHIGARAFQNCSSLTKINIPSGVVLYEDDVDLFAGCSALATVILDNESIAKAKDNSTGVYNANTIKLNTSITGLESGQYLFDKYVKTGSETGYDIYTKK